MRGLDPRIHLFEEGWIAGSSPAMTGHVFIKQNYSNHYHPRESPSRAHSARMNPSGSPPV
jgi:hypothetical protein